MDKSTFGIVGMGVMGRSLAKNMAQKGHSISVYNRYTPEEKTVIPKLLKELPEGSLGFTDLSDFVNSLASPRKILLMVQAGTVVDEILKTLLPLLAPNDIVIDGGNSHFKDTQRRVKNCNDNNIHFIGLGISGGEQGALNGPSMMAGGAVEAYEQIASVVSSIAAKDTAGNACVSLLGSDGCGHFIKTIHNGIEYAEMQLLAECYDLLKETCSYTEIADIFTSWNSGSLQSYLLEITASILRKKEGDEFLLDKVLDKAGNKGTGSWTSQTAFTLGVPASIINAAVTARYTSACKEQRVFLARKVQTDSSTARVPIAIGAVKAAYTFARMLNHAQGFDIIKAASKEYHWEVNLAEIARVWTAGCIIASDLMKTLVSALKETDDVLSHGPYFSVVQHQKEAVVQVLKWSLNNNISIPCISSSYNYFVAMTTAHSAANLIQAQRDEFGAHTYQRIDRPEDESFTSTWTTDE